MANEKETDASIAKLNDDLKKNFASNGTGSMAANCETVVKQFWLSHVFCACGLHVNFCGWCNWKWSGSLVDG